MVTGASRGLGRHACEFLAAHGASIAACARSEQPLTDLASRLSERGVGVHVEALDVADRGAVERFAAAAIDALGAPSLLLNNAGALGPVGPLLGADLEAWEFALRVNVIGTVNAIAAFVPAMVAAGGGSIVNLSGGGIGGPSSPTRVSAYTTSKAAVVGLTESLGRDLALSGIRVNAIAPGAVATGFNDPILDAGPGLAGDDLYSATLGQRERPEPFARFDELLLYLADDRSSWLTGRLLSARWESPDEVEAERTQIEGGSRYTLRRIDDALFFETTRDSTGSETES